MVLGTPAALDAGTDARWSTDGGGSATDGGDGSRAASSLSLTDGTRPNVYPDLARGAFDSSGSYYTAWMESSASPVP
jgi:hypothetical protein